MDIFLLNANTLLNGLKQIMRIYKQIGFVGSMEKNGPKDMGRKALVATWLPWTVVIYTE